MFLETDMMTTQGTIKTHALRAKIVSLLQSTYNTSFSGHLSFTV